MVAMNPEYLIHNLDEVFSPGLVFYPNLIRQNIASIVQTVKEPSRLCPHVKTHKTREIVQLELDAGITMHKCATIAEAEMLAQIGVPEVLISYPLVGPNVARLALLTNKYPLTQFGTLFDSLEGLQELAQKLAQVTRKVFLYLDVNVGQDRTGIVLGDAALVLYQEACALPQFVVRGLHVYDGHNHQEARSEREKSVQSILEGVLAFRKTLEAKGLSVDQLICGGTPTFPVWASHDVPGLICSPGTFVLHDHGYGTRYPDLPKMVPAALVITRLISKPLPDRVTFDLGTKAIASDPPAGKRLALLNIPGEVILQNEEHLVVKTDASARLPIGMVGYAVPSHVCPTVALHRFASIVENNRVVGTWDIVARDRQLTV